MKREWVVLRAGAALLGFAFLAGCGAAAHKNFDLETGAPADESVAEVDAALFGPSPVESDGYQIQSGDRLEIVSFTHPEQNRQVTVRVDGKITFPFVGDMQASGRAPTELSEELQEKLAVVLVNPRIDVLLVSSASKYYVFGEVRSPGEFRLEQRTDLLQALASAGGHTGSARLNNLVLLRKGDNGRTYAGILNLREYMAATEREYQLDLRAGDMLWVPRDLISRWDNATQKALDSIALAENVTIRGWSLVNFDQVFNRNGNQGNTP